VPARRWFVLAVLACGLLGACVFWRPLLAHLARVARVPALVVPGWGEALRLWATSLLGWAVLGLALWWQTRSAGSAGRWRSELREELLAMTRLWGPDPAAGLERGLERGPRAAHAAVEDGVLRVLLGGVARGVLGASRFAHRWIEGVFLEGTTRQVAQAATHGGRLAYRVMEQGGLEGLLRRLVRAVLAGSRWLQRRHTGRLRRNLVWVAASLALAVLGFVLFAW